MTRKIISFQIPKSNKEFVRFQVDAERYFYNKLHQHPQWQLTLIKEGSGQLMVGDYLGRFEPGDLFLFSTNMPHVFLSDLTYFDSDGEKHSLGHTLFFDFEALGKGLLEVEELAGLNQWLKQTKGSFVIQSKNKEILANDISEFKSKEGLDKLLAALQILQKLQQPDILAPLNQIISQKNYTETEGKRMGLVMSHILSHSQDSISLQDVADTANLSKEAFCRFFKERTGKTFTEFLTQVRIYHACQLLSEKDLSICQIAYQCGFQNLSYFNRAFKKNKGETPKAFRGRLSKIGSDMNRT